MTICHAAPAMAELLLKYETALKSRLLELLADCQARDELRIEYWADPLDQVRSSNDRDLAVDRLNQRAVLIRDIRMALTKIDEATYGFCEQCESTIARNRLAAIPWARLCLGCQSEAERSVSQMHWESAA